MKRFLSLFLAVLLVIGMVPADQLFAYSGSTVGIVRSTFRVVPGSGNSSGGRQEVGFHSVNLGSRGSGFVRLRAFPVINDRGDQYHFKVDEANKVISTVSHQELVNTPGYDEASKWLYLDGTVVYDPSGSQTHQHNDSNFLIHVFDDDKCEEVYIYKMHSSVYNQFLIACGSTSMDVNVSSAPELEALLTSDKEDRVAVGQMLGLSASEAAGDYYIIAESAKAVFQYYYDYRSPSQGGGWGYYPVVCESAPSRPTLYEWNIAETISTAMAKEPANRCSLIFGQTDSGWVGTRASGTDSKGTFTVHSGFVGGATLYSRLTAISWKQGDRAPWDGYTMAPERTNGYTIYGFGNLISQGTGGNVTVEYQGDVNTSEPDKFVSTGSIISAGTTTVNAWWDFRNEKWVDSDNAEELMRFGTTIKTDDEYSICFTSAVDYDVIGDIDIIPAMNDAYTKAPGQGYTDISLVWGNYPVASAPKNIGYTWKVATLDGYTNTTSIEKKFEAAFTDKTTSGNFGNPSSLDTTEQFKNEPVIDGCWKNAKFSMLGSTHDVMEMTPAGKLRLIDEEVFGQGYEFIIRGTPVISRKVTIKVDAENDETGSLLGLSVGSSETWREEYTTAREVECLTQADSVYQFVTWFAVPWQEDDSLESAIVQSLEGLTEVNNGTVKAGTYAPVDMSIVESKGDIGELIGLGSTMDEPPVGYTIYEVMFKVTGYQRPTVGEVILPSYMLNRYFNNIIQTSSALAGTPTKFTLARDWTWVEWIMGSAHCGFTAPVGYKDDWVIEYYDAAGSHEFGLDNSMIDRYYPRGTGTWSSSVRSKLTHAWQESMDTRNMPENTYVVDYAFNLLRANNDFGDKRSISGISYPNYVSATGDSDNLLKISAQFNVTPQVIKNASPARDSIAPLATYTEQFNIKSRFQHTASEVGEHVLPKVKHGTHWHSHGRYSGCYCSLWYHPGKFDVICGGFYGLREGVVNTINFQFKNTAYKYTTKNDLGVGKNDFLGGASSKPLVNGKRNSTSGSITDANFYRFATIRDTSQQLKYFPENYMVYKIGGTDFATINGQPYVKSYVMSEVKRTAASSGMYFFRLNANITNVPGTVYSDAMQGGTGMLGFNSTVSIPAGSDVTVAADPTGVAIDLYGYTLDLVAPDDNGKLGAVGAHKAYNTIVRSNMDAYHDWGNSSSHANLLAHFNTWCDNVLDVKNFAADFQLYVNTTTAPKSENFSATIGRVERGSGGTVEEGIYQLVVEKGILQTAKGDYSALIQQIATDYGCDTGTATAMFQESAIYTAIINAMETCKNPKNNSKDVFHGLTYTPDILASWTNDLGGDGNWYDETSRTFVIRRFTNLGNKLCDVIATDKIDYQLAPTATNPYGENANSAVSYPATWKLNIFFDQDAASNMNNLLLGSSTYYTPQNGNGSFNPANNAFSVLFNEIPVANADFVIPASSTQDFYN